MHERCNHTKAIGFVHTFVIIITTVTTFKQGSRDEAKQLKTSSSVFDNVERMQPRLSNQEGVNNCFLSKLQSFVHAHDDL